MNSIRSSLKRTLWFGQLGFRRSVVLVLFVSSLGACSLNPGVDQLCEPPGSRLEKPDAGRAIFDPVEEPPDRLEDGWPVSTLRVEGLDPEPIGKMIRAVEAGDYTKLDGILIARNGKLVLEAYFNGFDRDARHNIKSAFKSITSALVGIAVEKRLIADVNQPIANFFPDHWPHIRDDTDSKQRITLAHLLTMTSGFAKTPGLDGSADWVKFSLDQPMAGEPGTQYAYSDANPILVGGAIAQAAGEPVTEFAKKHLFNPLGITDYCWSLTPTGQAMTDGSFFMRPRDMLKFGQLYLDHGVWRGRRIISERWVTESTLKYVEFGRIALERWGTSPPAAQADIVQPYPSWSMLSRRGYGYYWWNVGAQPGNDSRYDVYYANGDGGQKIFNLPNLDLVVVVTGSHYGKPAGSEQSWEILHRFVLPAVLD